MEGRQLRDRESIALDLVGVVGLSAFLLGLTWLRTSDEMGFDVGGALDGVASQLAVTLPAAILIVGATVLELAAGLVLARAARRRPFDSLAEALLAAFVAAVLKDTILLGTLGAVGLFQAPALIGIDMAIIVVGLWLAPIARHVVPLTTKRGWRDAVGSIGSLPMAALVAIVWAGPVILQLASPVVPFIDVLPNYVGPVEHLRTFGWFEPLTATQSPIIGPSRTVLGYDAFLGSLASMTNLPGGLAIAGFILPHTILVAAGAHRLATALANGNGPVGPWALLAFALSQPFARLADARGTVVVVPLVCLGLAVAAELITSRRDDVVAPGGNAGGRGGTTGRDAATAGGAIPDPWRIGRGVVIGLSLGAATLVHPVIGFFAIVTVGIGALLQPRELATPVLVAGVTAGLIALPQLATMVGVSLPTLMLGIGLPVAIALGIGLGRLLTGKRAIDAAVVRLAEVGRIVLGIAAVVVLAVAFAIGILNVERIPDAVDTTIDLVLESSGILLVVLLAGLVLGGRAARSPIVLVGLAVGTVAVFLTQVLPDDLGFLGSALRFEVPKTVHYWLSAVAAAGAGSTLAYVWAGKPRGLPFPGRVAAAAAFVVVAALPLRQEPIDTFHLGEHRWSETFAIDLHYAETGFWRGFPDSRTVVDDERQEILDAVRAEIDAGRLQHHTPVLHIAASFQQWSSTPLGVFDGVTETFVSLDPEVSHQTVGGRLYGVERLAELLDPAGYPYVVLEPDGLPGGVRDQIEAAGYASIFVGERGEVFRVR